MISGGPNPEELTRVIHRCAFSRAERNMRRQAHGVLPVLFALDLTEDRVELSAHVLRKGALGSREKFLGGRILPLAANVYREVGAVAGPRRAPLLEFPSARRAASQGKEHSHETDSHKLQNQAGDDRGKSDRERVTRTADKIGGWFSTASSPPGYNREDALGSDRLKQDSIPMKIQKLLLPASESSHIDECMSSEHFGSWSGDFREYLAHLI